MRKYKYLIIISILVFIISIAGSYAYFAYETENTTAIKGNIVAIDADLTVELVVGTNDEMVPMLDGALSNAINGVGSNTPCIDSQGNLSCQVYKITLTNNGSRLKNLQGTIELYAKSGGTYTNLKWQELTNTTTIKEGSSPNGMAKSILVSELTLQSKEAKTWYIAVWISETDYDQTNTDKGDFGGTVEFEVASGSISNTITQDSSNANVPNIVDGMIPVYYSFDDGQWHKADQTNTDYNWFNYSEKKWANVVLLNSDTARDTYNSATNGTPIDMDDIAAFYVWIPRYKYRTWNINRQSCASTDTATCEAKYSYTAYSTGIEIEFESGTSSTGNVNCEYNVSNSSNPSTLSDECRVNNTTTITTSTDNTTFTGDNEAWYTHPAFTFGTGNEITGFWIGKFETTGSATSPTILPNAGALVLQKVSAQFTTSQLFGSSSTYGITDSGLNAHMLKNLEWGAVAYLSYSNYGMCNDTSCTGMYINNAYNSTTYATTGRSGGAIAGSPETVATHYPDSGSTSTNLYSDYGYYTYDGKEVAYDGTIGDYASDTTLGTNASTTGNVYGVYDMNGGSYEYVMADMYSIPTGNYVGPIGTSDSGFNGVNDGGSTLYSSGNALLATVTSSSITTNTDNLKYYDSYSYGTSYSAQTAWNRSRLGDATGEVVSGTSSIHAWKPGSGVNGSYSHFLYSSYSWFSRGGFSSTSYSGPFSFYRNYGNAGAGFSFRSSLS